MDLVVLCVFGIVYVGMALGRLPGLAVDRTGVALLGWRWRDRTERRSWRRRLALLRFLGDQRLELFRGQLVLAGIGRLRWRRGPPR